MPVSAHIVEPPVIYEGSKIERRRGEDPNHSDEFVGTTIAAAWNQVNIGGSSSTVFQREGALQIWTGTSATAAAADVRVLWRTAPTTTFTLITRLGFVWFSTGNYAYGGVVLRNSSNGNLLGLQIDVRQFVYYSLWTSPTVYGGVGRAQPMAQMPAVMYTRLTRRPGTSTWRYRWEVSYDGNLWFEIYNDTADQAGWDQLAFIGHNTNGINSAIGCSMWRCWTPASTPVVYPASTQTPSRDIYPGGTV